MYLTGHMYVFFGEMSIKNFCPFFDWVVCFFVVKLYELFVYFRDKALVLSHHFKIFFFHFIGCLFGFFYGFFCCAKVCKFVNRVDFK